MPRPKAQDLPNMTGPGVSVPKYKDLDRLGDKFIEVRDKKAELAAELGKIEDKIAEKMVEHNLEKYRFSDQEIVVKKGSLRVKIKTVKVNPAEAEEADPEEQDNLVP